MEVLELDDVEPGYLGRPILPKVNLTVEPGQIWALLGRNGGGKSTLLKTILGLLPPVRGRVVRRPGLRMSFVPQRGGYDLSVPSRVIDQVRGGVDHGWSFLSPRYVWRAAANIERALATTDTASLARRQLAELSEGQKQRVLIARAIVSDPELMVLDEPTSAMDPVAEGVIFTLLAKLAEERRMAMLIASHNATFAPRFATHAVYVDSDERVVSVGSVAEVTSGSTFKKRYEPVMTDHG